MTQPRKTGPAQPDAVERPQEDRSPARAKTEKRVAKPEEDDLPGAEGPLSAGANEDTYD